MAALNRSFLKFRSKNAMKERVASGVSSIHMAGLRMIVTLLLKGNTLEKDMHQSQRDSRVVMR